MKTKDILQLVISVGLIIGMVVGAITYFATAKDLQLTQVRLEQKIMGDAVLDIQKRMWALEDRNGGSDCSKWKNEKDKAEYRKLSFEVEMAKKKLEKIK